MNISTPAEIDRLITHGELSKQADGYGSVQDPAEGTSRASYYEYHKVCDMRTVFDTTTVGFSAIALTFLLVFTSWCAWHESVEWIGVRSQFEGQRLVEFALIVNALAALVLVLLIVSMRFMVGPILSYHWRSVFAVLLVMTAITAWEALEALVDVLIGSDAGERAVFYLVACGVVCLLTFTFERFFQYDVIGNHLIIPP